MARMSLAEVKAWVQQLDPARWSVPRLISSCSRALHAVRVVRVVYSRLGTLRWCKAVPTPYLTVGRWTLVRGMLTVDPEARLDAGSALHHFDACWSTARATPTRQSTSPVPQHLAK